MPFLLDDVILNFLPIILLYGEQYLKIYKFPILMKATLVLYPKLVKVVNKGNVGIVVIGIMTKDA